MCNKHYLEMQNQDTLDHIKSWNSLLMQYSVRKPFRRYINFNDENDDIDNDLNEDKT